MSIVQLSTSNTFYQWLNTTNEIVDTLNLFTDGGAANTFYVNTNIEIANNLTIGGNLTVTGNVTLDAVGYNDLTVAGNAAITGSITGANTSVENLTVTQNISSAKVTTTLAVGGDAEFYANVNVAANVSVTNLTVTSNIVFPETTDITVNNLTVNYNSNVSGNLVVTNNASVTDTLTVGSALNVTDTITTNNLVVSQNIEQVNVTSELYVGTDATIYGTLNYISGNTTLNNVSVQYGNFETANVTTLVGAANTQIYSFIEATANSVSAEALAADYLALAVALG